MSTPIIPSSPSRPQWPAGRTLTQTVRGVGFGRENHPSGGHYCKRIHSYHPSDPQIAWYLAHFIEEVRSVPADPVILRKDWLEAYNYVTDKGALALNDYARTNDPFALLGKGQVAVDVSSVIRASDNSFRVEWVERHYVDNALGSTERWSAILTITIQTPTDADRLKKNPLGIYVHALNWSKELG